jgi:hypothetical protein
MNCLTIDEIIDEVARTGTAKSDRVFLVNAHFRSDPDRLFKKWAEENKLDWETVDYDRGQGDRGQTIIFRRGPGWEPPATRRS